MSTARPHGILGLSVAEAVAHVCEGTLAVDALSRASLTRMDEVDAGPSGLNAIVYRDEGGARDACAQLVSRTGDRLPMIGVPVVVKDNIATLRMPTTCGSRILGDYVSPFEATAITRLRAAGAVVVGKTNMDEFGMGSSTEHSAFGPTRNPHDLTRVPGGSSGGSAAAVAAGVVRVALGSETGGSVRQPAALCGVVGVKPTYGRISRHGLVAFASSLDHVGVFGRTVDDAAVLLETVAGVDPLDATSADRAVPTLRASQPTTESSLRGMVVGWPTEYFPSELDPRIRALCERAADHLRARGAEIRRVSLPHTSLAIPVYYIVAPAEASSNLARFDGVRYGQRVAAPTLRGLYEATRSVGFGPEVLRRILLGTFVLSAGYMDAYYKRAMAVRALIGSDFAATFAAGVDVLLTPTTPTPAFPIGAVSDPYEMYLSDVFTVTANLAGIPAMSLPIGRVDGLPVGGQLMAPHFEEARLLRVAAILEHALGAEAHQ